MIRMKSYLLIVALCLSATFTFAQKNSIGPFAGINSSWVSDLAGDGDEMRNKIGLNAGLKYTYSNFVRFGLGADLYLSQEGAILKNAGEDTKTNLTYIRLPLKVYYFFNDLENPFRPKIYAGPSLGFLTNATVKVGDRDAVDIDETLLENFDLGLQVGTGFNYKFAPRSWFTFDLNYNHGLTKIFTIGDNRFNRSVGVTMGLAWGF